jgi:hypothetical protein
MYPEHYVSYRFVSGLFVFGHYVSERYVGEPVRLTVRYHTGGSMKLNAHILHLAHMVYS